MLSAFDILSVLITGFWFYVAIRGMSHTIKQGGRRSWIVAAMWFLMLIGGGGFFAAGFAAEGILKLPNSFEWPAGYVKGVKTMANGNDVVPLVPVRRLQIYAANWKFLRGWHVVALTGPFRAECPASGTIEVYTAKGNHHYTYTEQGELTSSTIYDGEFDSFPADDSYIVVPTSPLGWPFSSPWISLGVVGLGLLGHGIVEKFVEKHPKTGKSPTASQK